METAKILVVEDDADINGLLTAILKKQGYEVTSAFSGSEAGLCLQNGTYQLVLLDPVSYTHLDVYKRQRTARVEPKGQARVSSSAGRMKYGPHAFSMRS